ncbi:Serine/threonine-protein kinase PLK4 [Dissostichus eleginoides]|uniref:Serine/threonine-protein kinase PLK4 n=1 Tax=Dissostichus eleginoides TaxID=100907 RepID=A0AAD9F9D7_DISEL|nr:Serine/threonine-protein kinase PLK4 [Dissostichus eleginoides]
MDWEKSSNCSRVNSSTPASSSSPPMPDSSPTSSSSLLELLSSFIFRRPVFSPIFFWSGPPVRPEAHLYPPLLCRGAGRLLRQPPPALPHLAQQEKTQHHKLPHQQPGTGRPCHVHLLRPPDCILRF